MHTHHATSIAVFTVKFIALSISSGYPALMTRIAVASDLHIEFERQGEPELGSQELGLHPAYGPDLEIVQGEADFMVLAGDVDLGAWGIAYADEAARFLGIPVIYVAGNHEAYHRDLDAVIQECRMSAAATGGRVVFLENDAVEIAGVRVLGCSLWTDYELNGNGDAGMRDAAIGLADHQLIANSGRRFMPADALARHRESRRWLERELGHDSEIPTVVVSHHAPLREAVEPRFVGSALSPAFVSDLSDLIEAHAPAAWIWGHTHYSVDVTVGETRCISAQRGYPGEDPQAVRFHPAIIEL
jgi:predicted phosphodiesterase